MKLNLAPLYKTMKPAHHRLMHFDKQGKILYRSPLQSPIYETLRPHMAQAHTLVHFV